jgi:uncharacterized protein with NRDE domain
MENPILSEKEQTETFDNKVKELKNKGFNILEKARQMKVYHQIISNVLKGVYEVKGPQGIKNKPSKWDWKKIDTERSAKLPSLIRELRKKSISITKSVIAKELKLKDVSLRNLPNVKRGIKLLKN